MAEDLARSTNLGTQKHEAARLAGFFHSARKRHPADLTAAAGILHDIAWPRRLWFDTGDEGDL